MSEETKALVRKAYEDIRSEGRLEVADEIFATDYVGWDPTAMPPEVHGPEGFKDQTREYRAAFPDLRFALESVVAERDRVVVRWTATGTHKGSLSGETPTDKRVEVSGFGEWRVAGGSIAEHWGCIDLMGLLRQVGALS